MSLERALELAERGRGTTHPNPVVGCVIVRDGAVVGEGWHEHRGGPHAEVVALAAARELARGATAFVTMEPCRHHGATPPCVDALVDAGVARVVAGCRDPNPDAAGGLERLAAAGVSVELADGALAFRCRQQNEAWRTWVAEARPFVILKLAVTLDGRVACRGDRWVSGDAARRRVHELRAAVDAVAVGSGTAVADEPQLTARDVGASRQPRRLVFGSRALPEAAAGLERVGGPLDEGLARLAAEGVQSLLLEGGPTLATGFLRARLVDKLLLFVAPILSGEGVAFAPQLDAPVCVSRLHAERVGEDVLLAAYVHEP